MTDNSISPSALNPIAYASFYRRAIAMIIDVVILTVFSTALTPVLNGIPNQNLLGFGLHLRIMGLTLIGTDTRSLLLAGIALIYFACLEASNRQGTLGKQMLSIVVADRNGERVHLGRTALRYFVKMLSAIPLFIGFLPALITSRHTAFHDMVAGTEVLHDTRHPPKPLQ